MFYNLYYDGTCNANTEAFSVKSSTIIILVILHFSPASLMLTYHIRIVIVVYYYYYFFLKIGPAIMKLFSLCTFTRVPALPNLFYSPQNQLFTLFYFN